MSLPVEIRSAAAEDILHARHYYDDLQHGLGIRFVDEVMKVLARIGDMPEMYGIVEHGIRAAGVKRFGFVIYYRTKRKRVEIIAVVHGSRSSKVWKRRR